MDGPHPKCGPSTHLIIPDRKETVMPLTPAEYEAQRRRLEADAEDARKTLNAARRRFEALCDELAALRRAQNETAS